VAFFQTDTVLLLLFLVCFAAFLFRRAKPWMHALFGFACLLLAIGLKWNILIIGLLTIFVLIVILNYVRVSGGKKK